MPIKFISLNKEFINKISKYNFESYCMNIQDYKTDKITYYVSPANSLGFMDGGIDLYLSTYIFPNIENIVKNTIKKYGKNNKNNQKYLPIGSSIIIDKNYNNKYLIIAPTMLLPQNISKTNNAYYSTIAILYNLLINNKNNINDIDIIFTSMCCGYGKMEIDISINQILKAINNYKNYKPTIINNNVIINEPNLYEQPKYYENISWLDITPDNLLKKEYIYNNNDFDNNNNIKKIILN